MSSEVANIMSNLISSLKAEIKEELLEEFSKFQKDIVSQTKPFLSIKDASEYLNVSQRTMYGYVKDGLIGHYKPADGKIYFSVQDLNRYVLNEDKHYKSISTEKNKMDLRLKKIKRKQHQIQ